MQTTGQILKKELGLSNFQYVKIGRPIVSSKKILFVWYDSFRPDFPLTNYRIKKYPWTSMIFHGTDLLHGTDKAPAFTPAIDIEEYNGDILGALIITVDMVGNNLIKTKSFSKKFRDNFNLSKEGTLSSIKESLTMSDLMNNKGMSDFTKVWRKDRNRVAGAENVTCKLIDCKIDKNDNSVTFFFLTTATELNGKKPSNTIVSPYKFYKGDKGEVEPPSFDIKNNPSKTYTLQIKILDFFDWLDVFEGKKITMKDIKDIFEVSNIQVYSSDPSFYWQGISYWLTQLDGSVYPNTIKPQRWNAPNLHGEDNAFLSKHLQGLINQFKFFYSPMASMLTGILQTKKYI